MNPAAGGRIGAADAVRRECEIETQLALIYNHGVLFLGKGAGKRNASARGDTRPGFFRQAASGVGAADLAWRCRVTRIGGAAFTGAAFNCVAHQSRNRSRTTKTLGPL